MKAEYPAHRDPINWNTWVVCLFILLGVASLCWLSTRHSNRVSACEERDGTYVRTGKYGDPQCIKEGKIIIVWTSKGRVDNP